VRATPIKNSLTLFRCFISVLRPALRDISVWSWCALQWSCTVTRIDRSWRAFCTARKTATWRMATSRSSRSGQDGRLPPIDRGRRMRALLVITAIWRGVGELSMLLNRYICNPRCQKLGKRSGFQAISKREQTKPSKMIYNYCNVANTTIWTRKIFNFYGTGHYSQYRQVWDFVDCVLNLRHNYDVIFRPLHTLLKSLSDNYRRKGWISLFTLIFKMLPFRNWAAPDDFNKNYKY